MAKETSDGSDLIEIRAKCGFLDPPPPPLPPLPRELHGCDVAYDTLLWGPSRNNSDEDHPSLYYDEKVSLGECTAACGANLDCQAYQYHAASRNCRHLSRIAKSIAYAGNYQTGRCGHCTHVGGVDYYGADLTGFAGIEVASLHECWRKCIENDDCYTYTYEEGSSYKCWLKRQTGFTVKASAVYSTGQCKAKCEPVAAGGCSAFVEYDFGGSDLTGFEGIVVADLADCHRRCNEKADCFAYTFSTVPDVRCWLKNEHGFKVVDSTTSSYRLTSGQCKKIYLCF